MTCDICQDSKYIRLPTCRPLNVIDQFDDALPTAMDAGWKEFSCPQCVPMVPYRRVRAMKVTTQYPADYFGRLQMPIERSLAARFGEYLYREGLIRFSTAGSDDLGMRDEKITVTAHLGVVSREAVRKSGAVEEVASTAAPRPSLPERVRRRARVSEDAVQWKPPAASWPDEPVTDEFEEPKPALAARFSGLEI